MQRRVKLALWFMCVVAVVFGLRTWSFWQNGELLAGSHADGGYRYTMELLRISPGLMPEDPTAMSNAAGGFYENFYGPICWLAKQPGWDLFKANYVVCWLGNALFLAGMMLLLARLKLAPWACALGAFLAAQPYGLVRIASGVIHSVAIPREFWLWPIPFFLAWYITAPRRGLNLILFYAALGLAFCWSYPLTAIWFGLVVGLADVWFILREKRYNDIAWLTGAAIVCGGLVGFFSFQMARMVGSEDTATVEFFQKNASIYLGKGFRRYLVFCAVGLWAFWQIRRNKGWSDNIAIKRLWAIWLVSFVISITSELAEWVVPFMSLLILGRLSLLAYIITMVAVAACVSINFKTFPKWGKVVAVALLLIVSLEPVRVANEDRRKVIPLQPGFVEFCRAIKTTIPTDSLAIVPPGDQGDYYRVYAERGLWGNRHDRAVVMNVRTIFDLSLARSKVVEKFYAKDTSMAERESALAQMRSEGLDYVVTKSGAPWAESLSWPVVVSHGTWQLRAPTK